MLKVPPPLSFEEWIDEVNRRRDVGTEEIKAVEGTVQHEIFLALKAKEDEFRSLLGLEMGGGEIENAK